MHWIIWVGLIFILIGTALTIIGQQKVNNKGLQEIQNKSDMIEDLSQENIKLSNEITKINKEIAATVTGGDSYSYFTISGPNKSNVCDLMLFTEGEYPLYDVSIRIDDVEKMLNFVKNMGKPYDSTTEAMEHLFKYSISKKMGNLAPNQTILFGSITFSQKEKQSYNIYINARNGSVLQLFRFRKVNTK